MSSKRKLQQAAVNFRKSNPRLHMKYSLLISKMSEFILNSGAPEVTVGTEKGVYYEYANK